MAITIGGVVIIFLIYMAVVLIGTLAAHATHTRKEKRGKKQ